MAQLTVITDPDTALGFRLAGVEVIQVTAPEEAADRLRSLLRDKRPGIVIYDEEYHQVLSEKSRVALEESATPVFFAIPVARVKRKEQPPEEYLARLLRRAIGYQLKIRR